LEGFDCVPHAVEFAAVIHQLLPPGLRVGFKPAASEKPVEWQARNRESLQPDNPGDRSLRGSHGEEGINRAQNRDAFKNQIDERKNREPIARAILLSIAAASREPARGINDGCGAF